ncbi:hypothetical protein H920_10799 [Fukomys damarensis]|uniref:Uncharacterized protein n=1 Tax=Fukomys damarensis TaxID=885580 RepID=A0A091D6Q8_FUKDA|nr:hypothetical protein H920_10799 [Fukomys damarensis]
METEWMGGAQLKSEYGCTREEELLNSAGGSEVGSGWDEPWRGGGCWGAEEETPAGRVSEEAKEDHDPRESPRDANAMVRCQEDVLSMGKEERGRGRGVERAVSGRCLEDWGAGVEERPRRAGEKAEFGNLTTESVWTHFLDGVRKCKDSIKNITRTTTHSSHVNGTFRRLRNKEW